MVCPACGLANDPPSTVCARCDAAPAQASVPPPDIGPRPPGRRRWLPVAVVSVLLTGVIVVLAVVLDRGDEDDDDAVQVAPALTVPALPQTESAPEPTARQQAAAIDGVLSDSAESRRKLNDAIQRVGRCTGLARAVADLRDVGTERRSQIEIVRATDLSALPGGAALRSGLIAALTYALRADQGFLGWAQPATTAGCARTTSRDRAYRDGEAASDQAGAATRRFLAMWKPVAVANGLSNRSATGI